MRSFKGYLCILLVLIFSTGNIAVFAEKELSAVIEDTAAYLYETVKDPQVGSIGGEWAVFGLARSGCEIPEAYYQNYYETVEEYVTACQGNLHNRKYTEYARLIVTLTAIGKDPSDVAGYDLLTPLGDYDKTIWQGLNGSIWALLSLDSIGYEMPQNPKAKVQATREMYINRILECQLADGGWSLTGKGISDPDITGMALQALAKYQDNEAVKKATEEALACMSLRQNEQGGFTSWNAENSESCVQMLAALCELGIPLEDERFVKNGNTMLDNLLTYYDEGNGFLHTLEGSGSSQMATEQGFYGLVAVQRAIEGKNSLYRMSDAITLSEREKSGIIGLEGKHPDVQKREILSPGKTFGDISGHESRSAIEALAAGNIINGKTEDTFDPDATMTRAEFAAIVVRALGLPEKGDASFADVTAEDWFYDSVNTAHFYGIINGVSETAFHPNDTISRQQAAVMVARGAKLCGMDTEVEIFAARDILAGFIDYVKAADWAVSSLAFCCREGIIPDEEMELLPMQAVTRAEVSQMLFHMLSLAKLI